ncbi:MAG: EVE domain-containing protein [Proteobacteria bacterium]|nr:EVE domain-containing protein [Pseudomonadota bacterium]
MTQQFWIGTVSKEHVLRGKAEGFAQVCHGKEAPLKRMQVNDLLLYYSPTEKFGEKTPYQSFTAIGVIQPGDAYQVTMNQDFKPFRRDVKYLAANDTPIRPLIPKLSFIRDKTRWGSVFRFGILKIPKEDFIIIAKAMGLTHEQIHELLI